MAERRIPVIERILYRIENHIEEWRRLVEVMPASGGLGTGLGIKGAWLVFEPAE